MQLLQEFHETIARMASPKLRFKATLATMAALLWGLSACAPDPLSPRLSSKTLAQANTILDEISQAELMLSPEAASRMGFDGPDGANTSARLDDHSQAGFERRRLIRIDLLARIQTRPRLPANQPVARDLIIVEDALSRLVQLQTIGHGQLSLSSARPYAIDPYSGVWIEGPGLLANDHHIKSADEALAYLNRLEALPDAIDDTRRRLIADAESGLVPPAALLLTTKIAVDRLLGTEPDPLDRLSQTLTNLIQSVPDLDQNEATQLTAFSRSIIAESLRPAYRDLSATLEDMLVNAPIQAGLWAQPGGHVAYQSLLQWYVAESLPLDNLHQANIDDVALRTAAFQQDLDRNGLVPAPLPERLTALAEMLEQAALDAELARAEQVPAPVTDDLLTDELAPAHLQPPATIKRPLTPPPFTGYVYLPARFDGQRPALVSEHQAQLDLWPAYMLTALRFQQDILLRQPFVNMNTQRRSNARALIQYPGFQDAWRMYAAEEYSADHFTSAADHTGQSHLFLLQAAMAAADTGLHHKRWSLDQTAAYLTETTGLPMPLMREAALRITASPGRAAARMIGYRRLVALKTRARAVLGNQYDETSFQSVLLTGGPRPFRLIERDVERWYEAQLSAANQDTSN